MCTRLVTAAARFAGDREIGFAAYQELDPADFDRLGVTRSRCEARLRFRSLRGRWRGGALAVNAFVWAAAPRGWRGLPARTLAAAFTLLPPLLLLEMLAYEVVARNRGCSAPAASADSGPGAHPG